MKEVLLNKKAIDVILLEVTDVTVLTDYFVLATGMNKKQVEQLFAHYCEEALEEEGIFKLRKEASEDWVLIDYGDVIVHLFLEETRSRYGLEKIWHKGKVIES
ncbi:hypothetical protein AZF37_05745 [endosymbiont 'TC1' of Trimyema compressum]|uniref:ribosome silencing factor n=1 Tax=endosymbiont 'TC1' of Trimyema compressum TaxID=243899 RepID=UPI0007F09A25|nr:ribosome silencing factor [endosymbiont 'TC1' of Trimyema compressum]AMP20743.1 hypothetical protein AZF37_05745 [endosymbiont 'TC1' of Trimyema compressum]